jgi:hypothetical protein
MLDNPTIASSWQPWSLGFILSTEVAEAPGASSTALDRLRAAITSAGAHKIVDETPTSFRFKRKFPGWSMSALNFVDKGEVRLEHLGVHTLISVKTSFLPWVAGGAIFAAFVTMQGFPLAYMVAIVALVILINGVCAYFALRNLLARSTRADARAV